uniref:Uncharacterized protein n=1 Tax=Amphilophus citrinellus TaxID=61819 RepID=A0A3Q0SQT7_AMPCI
YMNRFYRNFSDMQVKFLIDAVVGLLPTHRQCSTEITSNSTYTLCNAWYSNSVFTMAPHAARGAVGIFTYELHNKSTQESTEKIAVMFSVPYDFNLSSNWFAVGIFQKTKECNYDLYYQMYNNTDSMFVRGKASGPSLTHKFSRVTILASILPDNILVTSFDKMCYSNKDH